jgi:hypothetical protein
VCNKQVRILPEPLGMQTPRRKPERIEVAVRSRKLDTPNQRGSGSVVDSHGSLIEQVTFES